MFSGKFVFISIAMLVLISGAGCIDNEVSGAPVNTPAPVSTEIVTATAIPEPTEVPVSNWWDTKPDYTPAKIPANENLFGVEIEGIKYDKSASVYSMFDENQNQIFTRFSYTPSNLDLALRLQPEQYSALIDQYGYMESVTMEQIDDDRDGKFDRVAVKYVGDEGVLEFETEYREGAVLSGYLYEMITTQI